MIKTFEQFVSTMRHTNEGYEYNKKASEELFKKLMGFKDEIIEKIINFMHDDDNWTDENSFYDYISEPDRYRKDYSGKCETTIELGGHKYGLALEYAYEPLLGGHDDYIANSFYVEFNDFSIFDVNNRSIYITSYDFDDIDDWDEKYNELYARHLIHCKFDGPDFDHQISRFNRRYR